MGRTYLCGECHTPRRKQTTTGNSCGHHAEFAMFHECNEVLNLFLQIGLLKVLLLVRIGRLAAGIGGAERSHLGCEGD